MMEKSHAGERHDDPILIARLYHKIIAHRSARLGDVFNARKSCTLDVIRKWEKRVRSE